MLMKIGEKIYSSAEAQANPTPEAANSSQTSEPTKSDKPADTNEKKEGNVDVDATPKI